MARMTNGDSEAKSAGINKNNFTYLCAQLASMCYPIRVTNGGSEAKSAGINKNNFIYLCAQLAYGCYLVRITGVEPARTCVHMDLNMRVCQFRHIRKIHCRVIISYLKKIINIKNLCFTSGKNCGRM